MFNNLIVIASFILYAIIAQTDQNLAFLAIAIGNPLGVFVQMAFQIPALKKVGIRLRPRIDWHDPALADTLRLGAPAVFVTVCSFATVVGPERRLLRIRRQRPSSSPTRGCGSRSRTRSSRCP